MAAYVTRLLQHVLRSIKILTLLRIYEASLIKHIRNEHDSQIQVWMEWHS